MGSEDQSREKTGPAEGPGRTPDGATAVSGDDPENHGDSSLPRGSGEPEGLHEKAWEEKIPLEISGSPGPRQVSQFGNSGPGAAESAGQDENGELEWARRHVRDGAMEQPAPHLPRPPSRWRISEKQPKKRPLHHKTGPVTPEQAVFRKTELHDRPSSLFTTGEGVRKKRRPARGRKDRLTSVPPEMPAYAASLLSHLDNTAEDLYHRVALVDEQVGKLDKKFRKIIRDLEWRVVALEERGRVP